MRSSVRFEMDDEEDFTFWSTYSGTNSANVSSRDNSSAAFGLGLRQGFRSSLAPISEVHSNERPSTSVLPGNNGEPRGDSFLALLDNDDLPSDLVAENDMLPDGSDSLSNFTSPEHLLSISGDDSNDGSQTSLPPSNSSLTGIPLQCHDVTSGQVACQSGECNPQDDSCKCFLIPYDSLTCSCACAYVFMLLQILNNVSCQVSFLYTN